MNELRCFLDSFLQFVKRVESSWEMTWLQHLLRTKYCIQQTFINKKKHVMGTLLFRVIY